MGLLAQETHQLELIRNYTKAAELEVTALAQEQALLQQHLTHLSPPKC